MGENNGANFGALFPVPQLAINPLATIALILPFLLPSPRTNSPHPSSNGSSKKEEMSAPEPVSIDTMSSSDSLAELIN